MRQRGCDDPLTRRIANVKAVLCRQWGEPESLVIGEAPSRPLQPHEVRIRVSACGVNFADTLQIAGKYQVRPPFPFTPGLEVVGDIAEAGSDARGLRVGQRVLAHTHGNAYAEEAVVPAAAAV